MSAAAARVARPASRSPRAIWSAPGDLVGHHRERRGGPVVDGLLPGRLFGESGEPVGRALREREVAELDRTEAGREQLGPRGRVRHRSRPPVAGFDDPARFDAGQGVDHAHLVRVARDDLAHEVDPPVGALEVAELEVAVLAPVECVDHVACAVAGLPQSDRRIVGGLVRIGDLLPHAVLDEDVRGHVARVGDRGRDAGEAARGRQGERRVHRVVEGVDRVMGRAGVVRIPVEQVESDRSRKDAFPLAGLAHGPRPH